MKSVVRTVTFTEGTQSKELRRSILQDFGKNKTRDYLKKETKKVVNQ